MRLNSLSNMCEHCDQFLQVEASRLEDYITLGSSYSLQFITIHDISICNVDQYSDCILISLLFVLGCEGCAWPALLRTTFETSCAREGSAGTRSHWNQEI